jgi:hypothetical protein
MNTVCIRGVKKDNWRYLKSEAAKTDATLAEILDRIISNYKTNVNNLAEISEKMGLKDEQIVRRALLLYKDSIESDMELRREFEEWGMLSDEALETFEENL